MTTTGVQIDILSERERPFSWRVAARTGDIAHRQLGPRPNMVLVHGLAMSGAYFIRFANSLFQRGWSPIAPDLPGFGQSSDAPASGVEGHASALILWADALGIRDAVWVGHCVACNVVAHVARTRPDLVREVVFIGPLWTRGNNTHLRFLARLVLDGMREPLGMYRWVLHWFFRAGIRRWWSTWRRFAADLDGPPILPGPALFLAGARDPLPDRTCGPPILEVSGAHACFVSHPEETAEAVNEWLRGQDRA